MPFDTPPTVEQISEMRDAHIAAITEAYAGLFTDPPTLTLCEALEAEVEAHQQGIIDAQNAMVAAGCGA